MNASRMNEVAAKAREKVYTNTLSLVYQTIEGAAQGGHTNVKFMIGGTVNLPRAVVLRIEEKLIEQGYRVKVMDSGAVNTPHLLIDWTIPKA